MMRLHKCFRVTGARLHVRGFLGVRAFSAQTVPGTTALEFKKRKGLRDIKSEHDSILQGAFSAPMPDSRKASAYCAAESFDWNALKTMLVARYSLLPFMADDVFHVSIDRQNDSEAFIFSNGSLCAWGVTDAEMKQLIADIKPFEINSYGFVETEPGGMSTDDILLGHDIPLAQAKLVYASGMSRSVKLACFEVLLERHLDKNKHIPEMLKRESSLKVSRSDMMRNLGELLQLRGHFSHIANVNLQSEMLDLPDFCWSSRTMETYFASISRNLDVRPRITIINKKLDYANEIAELMRDHLNSQHGLKLEWAIIILISIEIVLSLSSHLGFFEAIQALKHDLESEDE